MTVKRVCLWHILERNSQSGEISNVQTPRDTYNIQLSPEMSNTPQMCRSKCSYGTAVQRIFDVAGKTRKLVYANSCTCEPFYEGSCCDRKICLNGGWLNQAQICTCADPHFYGNHCEFVACENGGIVLKPKEELSNPCQCEPTFSGRFCEISTVSTTAKYASILAALVVICVIALTICMKVIRSRRLQRTAQSISHRSRPTRPLPESGQLIIPDISDLIAAAHPRLPSYSEVVKSDPPPAYLESQTVTVLMTEPEEHRSPSPPPYSPSVTNTADKWQLWYDIFLIIIKLELWIWILKFASLACVLRHCLQVFRKSYLKSIEDLECKLN